MKACIHPGGRRPHALRRDRGAAGGLDLGQRSAGRDRRRPAELTRRGRRACASARRVPRHPVESDPHRRWPDPLARRGRGIAARRDRRADRPRPAGHAGVRHPAWKRTPWRRSPTATGFWHRMGDSGYLDEQDRFWFCGRVAHRVLTADGPMYPVRCEAIFNQHPAIRRSALVGVGPAGRQRPVIVLEPHRGANARRTRSARGVAVGEIRQLGAANPLTAGISDFLLHPEFPGRHSPQRQDLPREAGRLGKFVQVPRLTRSQRRRCFGPLSRPSAVAVGSGLNEELCPPKLEAIGQEWYTEMWPQ